MNEEAMENEMAGGRLRTVPKKFREATERAQGLETHLSAPRGLAEVPRKYIMSSRSPAHAVEVQSTLHCTIRNRITW